ncbi:alpha/beta hydrolase [Paenibacillus hexagrammi]|uniref:Alpha/beta hydrolase n=1 Tax=Paenibacillus hexagrammi TaxID=2908839 RepID=A0ABY3SJT8_9BACL|nr:alpha/beta hydrolase [Paenibacillus sp. YPD9-1]UJF33504.1 alpha/beta hydrolase [Paenibacillus sp. YPD9-1]
MTVSNPAMIQAIKLHMKMNFRFLEQTVEEIRQAEQASLQHIQLLQGTKVKPDHLGGLYAEWVTVEEVPAVDDSVVMYVHGGSFITGSCETHRDLAARISQASGVPVLLFNYRLAPEHPYPAANEDCLAVYRALLDRGYSPDRIVIGGESIGGYLALTTLLTLRESREVLPAASFLLSPHTDFFAYDGESYQSRADVDGTGSIEVSRKCAQYYFGTAQMNPSVLSPQRSDLKGLPPLLIQVGDQEVLLSDSLSLAERATEAGVSVELEVWEEMWHVFQLFASMVEESGQAIRQIGRFVRRMMIS